jgi:hypothetical protein
VRSWRTDLRRWSGTAAAGATAPTCLAAVRTGVGTVMLLAPGVLPQLLGVDAAARARTSWLVQMLGVREVALGAGVLLADRSGTARSWAVAGSASDVVDALVVGSAVRRGVVHRSWGSAVALSALAAGAAGLARSRC